MAINVFQLIKHFFKLTDEERNFYKEEMEPINARNAFYLSLVALPVSLVHIVLFADKLERTTGVEHTWASSIMWSHMTTFALTLIGSLLLYFFFYRNRKVNRISRFTTYWIISALLILGAVLASFDQYVTSAITPFLNTTILVGLFFQIRPGLSGFYYFASYLLFYVGVSMTQTDPDVLISNQVNGLSITVIGWCLSMILWKSNLTKIRQNQFIIKQNRALSESNAEKDKFFSIIAHDLKSPFVSIQGFSDLLMTQVQEKDYEGIDKYAQIIKQSSKSAMDLLMNLMEWSNAQTGRLEFVPEPFVLNELVHETRDLFAAAMLEKKIHFSSQIAEKTVVLADKNMIRTILRNLMSNAIKFTQEEGHLTMSVDRTPQEYLISVSDDGIGIPSEAMHRLFKLNETYSTMGTKNEKGTGLGLILCKDLVERHRGRIWGESELGKGSTFHFTLPQPLEMGR